MAITMQIINVRNGTSMNTPINVGDSPPDSADGAI